MNNEHQPYEFISRKAISQMVLNVYNLQKFPAGTNQCNINSNIFHVIQLRRNATKEISCKSVNMKKWIWSNEYSYAPQVHY